MTLKKWIKVFDSMLTDQEFRELYEKTDNLISKLELLLAYHDSANHPYESNVQKILPIVIDRIYELEIKEKKLLELVENLWNIIEYKDNQIKTFSEPEWNVPDNESDAAMLGLRNKTT